MSQTKAQLISDLVQALNFTGTSSAPTNGMYLSAANTISLGINTAELLTVNGTRILTKSPSGTNTTVRFQHTGNSGYGDIILDRSVNAFIIDNDPTNASNNQSYFAVKNKGATNFHIKFDGKVGIGTTDPSVLLNVVTTGTDAALFESTAGDANGVQLSLRATSASPADNDKLAVLDFSGKDDAGNNTTYAQIRSHSRDVSNGTEDGDITFHTRHNGTFDERLRITSDGSLQIGASGDAAEAPLHVTAENSQGINAIFGAKDFIDDDQYNYDDANIALQGRDASNNETGAGVQFTVRNTGGNNWLHGAFVLDRDANYILYRGVGNTDGTERLRIDDDKVIIGGGAHAGGANLVVKGIDGETPNAYAAAAFCKIGANPTSGTTLVNLRFSAGATGTNRAAEITVKADSNWNDGTSQESKMIFTVASSGGGNTAGNPLLTLKGTGDVEVNRGNLVLANTQGIDFSATSGSGTSELLDDYEEGTFTPSIGRVSGSPTVGYAAQDGYYTKTGRIVHFFMEIRLNSWDNNGASGTVVLNGLPFTAAARTGGRGAWDSVTLNTYNTGKTTTAGSVDIGVVAANNTRIELYIMGNEAAYTSQPEPDGNDQFKVGGYYFV